MTPASEVGLRGPLSRANKLPTMIRSIATDQRRSSHLSLTRHCGTTRGVLSAKSIHLRQTNANWGGRGCSSVGRASDRHAAESGSISRRGKNFSSLSQLSEQTLLRCPYSPRVQSHAFTSMRTLKIPSISTHTFVWTYENTARTVRKG